MFPWKTTITINRAGKRALYLQLSDAFIKQITAGRIPPGMRIPGSRVMAEMLSVNRKTIIQTYEELLAQDWIEIRPSKGTFISENLPLTKAQALEPLEHNTIENGQSYNRYDYIESYQPLPRQSIQVNGGSPDARIAPMDWIYKECRSAVKMRNGHKLLQYDDAHGNHQLRQVLAKYLAESRGMHTQPANILITRGSQMGIFLAASAILKKDETVVVGNTSYDAADWAFQYQGAHLLRVPVDNDGLDIDQLEKACRKGAIKMVYVTPHHHFPTTVTLANARRVKLLALAEKYNFYILEDDYDFDFHYKSAPLLPLASIDSNERVIYIGSFSKIFAASIRIGYIIAPSSIIEELSKLSRVIDRQGDHVMQRVMAEMITSGDLNRHLKKSLKIYRERRDHLAHLLDTRLKEHVSSKVPEGGMAIWITFKKLDLLKLKPLFEQELLYLDIDQQLAAQQNAFRFGFASLTKNEMNKIVEIMESVIKQLSS